jgi:hypothetical protein
MTVNLYKLEKKRRSRLDYDCAVEFVVAAGSEDAARQAIVDAGKVIGEDGYGAEGPETWLSELDSSCTFIGFGAHDLVPGILCREVVAG